MGSNIRTPRSDRVSDICCNSLIGSVAATYVLEHLGGQSHAFTFVEFMTRYEEHFPPLSVSLA